MKTECSIVMDLLPLYVEELVSEQTAEYVSRHLGECPNCQAEFNIMKGGAKIEISESVPAPKVDNIPPFKKVMKRMNRVFYSLSYSLIIFFIFLGFGWTAGENLMYNSLIMPIVGIFGYCAFGYRSVYKIPALLLIIDLFVCVFKLVQLDLYSAFMWTIVYSLFVLVGIAIAFLLHYAIRKDEEQ